MSLHVSFGIMCLFLFYSNNYSTKLKKTQMIKRIMPDKKEQRYFAVLHLKVPVRPSTLNLHCG